MEPLLPEVSGAEIIKRSSTAQGFEVLPTRASPATRCRLKTNPNQWNIRRLNSRSNFIDIRDQNARSAWRRSLRSAAPIAAYSRRGPPS